jgi:hypothetical protein
MTMILLEKASGLAINPADLSSMRIRHSSGGTTLELAMRTGEVIQVAHRPATHEGADIYSVHKQLMEVA